MDKVKHVLEIKSARRCNMLVGPSGTGKTTIWQCAEAVMQRLHKLEPENPAYSKARSSLFGSTRRLAPYLSVICLALLPVAAMLAIVACILTSPPGARFHTSRWLFWEDERCIACPSVHSKLTCAWPHLPASSLLVGKKR